VGDGDGEVVVVAQPELQLVFPGARGNCVAAAAVGDDGEVIGTRVAAPPLGAPPLVEGGDGELRGVVGGAHEDRAAVGVQIVDAVGDGGPEGIGAKVVVVDEHGLTVPGAPVVLEAADELLLLGVDADDRQPLGEEVLAQFADAGELGVAVGGRAAGELLVGDAHRVVHLAEQPRDGALADLDAERAKLDGDLARGSMRPFEPRHGIAGGVVAHQLSDAGEDFGRFFPPHDAPPQCGAPARARHRARVARAARAPPCPHRDRGARRCADRPHDRA